MQRQTRRSAAVLAAALVSCALVSPPASAGEPTGTAWEKIVNNGQLMPESTKLFNSYNQPSINARGLVVFRARSKGPGQPTRGIYTVDLFAPFRPVAVVASVASEVPQPNNIEYPPNSGELATFQEFPSFPRIDAASDMIATRGQSQPVWNYLLPDGTETSVGTSGVYATVDGTLATGVSLLGNVADATTGELAFPWWQVPGAPTGTRFDQFPGAAAAFGDEFIAFKGNYTEPVTLIGRTGVYVRSMRASKGRAPVEMIANSLTPIPGQEAKVPVLFGSTAPPSAAAGRVVFVGLDNEEAPTMGGIYLAEAMAGSELIPLVAIGDLVPGEGVDGGDDAVNDGELRFNRIGEALSFDGRWVAFWGAWGSETRTKLLVCPTDGNADVLQYCNEHYPAGLSVEVPVHQGIFAIDTWSGLVTPIAKTGKSYDDFVYWNFSGSPGTGGDEGGDQEPPRWRSTSFLAIDGTPAGAFRAVFKARLGTEDAIMLRVGPAGDEGAILVSTLTPGTDLDAQAPAGSLVSAIGIERDGLRNGRLALAASMLNATTGEAWAGIYVAEMPPIPTCAGDVNGDGTVGPIDLVALLDRWGACAGCGADLDGDGVVGPVDLAMLLSDWGECE